MQQQRYQQRRPQQATWLMLRWVILTVIIFETVIQFDSTSTTSTTTSSSTGTGTSTNNNFVFVVVDARPNFPQFSGGGFPRLADIASPKFRINNFGSGGKNNDDDDKITSPTLSSSLSMFSKPKQEQQKQQSCDLENEDSPTSTKASSRPFLSKSRRYSTSLDSRQRNNRDHHASFKLSSDTDAERVNLVSSSSQKTVNKRRSSNKIKNDIRGGAAVASRVVKTMTARRMETFKFLSGGVAGTVAACITNPLEVIKTQLQSSNKELLNAKGHPVQIAQAIMEQDGVSGFFRGLPPTLVGIIPSRSAYFYAYQRIKSFLNPTFPEGSPPNALIAGFMAGIVGNTLTNPIWMVRTRMQLLIDHTAGQRAYAGYGDAIATIFREEGIGGFYKGISASYWGCAEGALQFIIYEQIKTKLLDRQNKKRAADGLRPSSELPNATYFWAAAASKCVAAIATYPHEVARTRMREQARAGVFKYQQGMWKTIGVMAKEEGVRSLYSGMGVHLMKVVPNSALMFLTYEVVRSWLDGYEVVGQ